MRTFLFTNGSGEETAAGKSLSTAIEAAYDKAFSAIFDANVTTLITAVILFWQATGSVKGFAVTHLGHHRVHVFGLDRDAHSLSMAH